ncbi:MAG: ABC transporter permease subunit [Deltaproteobacteria bacterium]|jgi:ABC-type transport system involved in multi-copper enzyme maturation permease subunit|nr:ABC transporter permease subunit [Deltaproteobacteria bacterium]MBW2533073.1 ABC transporter permease subunit [Deltaproteobacteria bacterium]
MLHRVSTVALNGYRESVRARVLIGLACVAFAVAFYSLIVGAYTLREAPRVVSDLGAAGMSLFSIAVAVAISATTLHRELEQKTIMPVLARPLRRTEYLVGKYLGTMLVVAVFIMADSGLVLMMCSALAGRSVSLVVGLGGGLVLSFLALAWRYPRVATFGPIALAGALFALGLWACSIAPLEQNLLFSSALLSFLEVGIVAAIATLFASFSTPVLTTFFTCGLWILGRSADSLTRLPAKFFGEAIHDAGVMLSKVVPNLHVYVPARPLLTGEALDANLPAYVGMGALHAMAWIVGLLACASFIFKRRDFL